MTQTRTLHSDNTDRNEFINALQEELKAYFDDTAEIIYDPNEGGAYGCIKINEFNKLDEPQDMNLFDKDLNEFMSAVPYISIDRVYPFYVDGKSVFDIAMQIMDEYNSKSYSDVENSEYMRNFLQSLTDYNEARQHIILKAMSRESFERESEELIYGYDLDIVFVPSIFIQKDGVNISIAPVTRQLFDKWNQKMTVTESMVMSDAINTMNKIMPPKSTMLIDFTNKYGDMEASSTLFNDGFFFVKNSVMNINVVTNDMATLGAGYIADGKLIRRLSDRKDIWVVPSSIHEFMYLDKSDDDDISELEYKNLKKAMDANMSYLKATGEFLSDNIYVYSYEDDTLSIYDPNI